MDSLAAEHIFDLCTEYTYCHTYFTVQLDMLVFYVTVYKCRDQLYIMQH